MFDTFGQSDVAGQLAVVVGGTGGDEGGGGTRKSVASHATRSFMRRRHACWGHTRAVVGVASLFFLRLSGPSPLGTESFMRAHMYTDHIVFSELS